MSNAHNAAANLVAGLVTGKVTDLTGNGLAGIEVHASPLEGGDDAHDTTKESGTYQITNLMAGKYDLHVSSPGQFEPPHYRINMTQNQNLTGRHFKKIRDE